jgi:hypothetical protein
MHIIIEGQTRISDSTFEPCFLAEQTCAKFVLLLYLTAFRFHFFTIQQSAVNSWSNLLSLSMNGLTNKYYWS